MTLQMSSRQRMLTTFGLQEPDRVPVIDEVFNVEIFEAALGYRPEYITSEDTFGRYGRRPVMGWALKCTNNHSLCLAAKPGCSPAW